jgi:hypothetical protein
MFKRQHPQPHSTLPEGSSAELADKQAAKEAHEKERLVRRFQFPHWGGPLARVVFVVVVITFFAIVFGLILRHVVPFWKVLIERTVG